MQSLSIWQVLRQRSNALLLSRSLKKKAEGYQLCLSQRNIKQHENFDNLKGNVTKKKGDLFNETISKY